MANEHGRPVGSIFLFEGKDLAVQPDVERAERFVEPFDVAGIEAYDELGRRLQGKTIGEHWPRRVELSVADAEADPSALISRVRAFMEAIGEQLPSEADSPTWLREATAILLAR